jgi:phosphopantetheine adenylyltransferase
MGKTVVVYAGGFQPFHQGHLSSYQQAKRVFPDADFYVAASADTKQRPIPYEEKKFLATQAGVDPEDFPNLIVKSPLNPKEILSKYNPQEDRFILVRSERDPMTYTKKDGTPGYYQPFVSMDKLLPFSKQGYVFVTNKEDFNLGDQVVYSGTQVRDMYANADEKTRINIVKQLYPNSKKQKTIKSILDQYIGKTIQESIVQLVKTIKPLLLEANDDQKKKFYNLLKSAKSLLSENKNIQPKNKKPVDYLEEK